MQDSLTRRNVLTIGTAAAAASISTAQAPVGYPHRCSGRRLRLLVPVASASQGQGYSRLRHSARPAPAAFRGLQMRQHLQELQRNVEASGTRRRRDLHTRTAARVDGH